MSPGNVDWSKAVFIGTCVVVILGAAFGAGIYVASNETPLYKSILSVKVDIQEAFTSVEETSVLVPEHFLQPARGEGRGVTVNDRPGDEALIFLAGFFEDENQLRLIRRDGTVVQRWPVSFKSIFPEPDHLPKPPATDWNIDTHGALIEPDGSVVFNLEYAGLVKLDRCGRLLWALKHLTHHSVERAADGSYWVPGRKGVPPGARALEPFPPPYGEDLILNVSSVGEVLAKLSVPRILYENGLEPLLTATGESFKAGAPWDREIVHLNKVGVLGSGPATAFPGFQGGDLVLSLREHNLVMVVDPRTRQIKWHQVGPWIRQHDPEFNADGTITVFNNNAYRTALLEDEKSDPAAPRTSNIVRVDPVTGRSEVVFGEKPGQRMLTVIRGKHEVLDHGGFLITEFEAGRVLETSPEGEILWEYINRYDEDTVAEVTEARLYPAEYFDVADWSCPPR